MPIEETYAKELIKYFHGTVDDYIWCEDAVAWAVENGITNGVGDVFDPEGLMMRAEAVTFLQEPPRVPRAVSPTWSNLPGANIDDVPDESWFTGSVAWATENGVTIGTGDNNF